VTDTVDIFDGGFVRVGTFDSLNPSALPSFSGRVVTSVTFITPRARA
jgi:hypothetical protein